MVLHVVYFSNNNIKICVNKFVLQWDDDMLRFVDWNIIRELSELVISGVLDFKAMIVIFHLKLS